MSRDLTKLTKEELVTKIDGCLAKSLTLQENFYALKQRSNSLEEINKEMMEIFLWVHREIEFWSVPMMREQLNEKLRELDDKYKIRN